MGEYKINAMMYQTTITTQRQMTIPVEVWRKYFAEQKLPLKVNLDATDNGVILKKEPEIDELAGSLRMKKKIDMKKARKAFEHYLATRSFKNL